MAVGDRFCHSCGWDVNQEPPPPPLAGQTPPRPVSNPSGHNRLAVFLLCLLLGWLGIHRFYVGKIGTGILWACTLGFLSVGVIYDLVLIATGEFRDIHERRIVHWQ